MSFKDKIAERKLDPGNIAFAAFIAGLNELRLLNQGAVNIGSRRMGKYLSEYMKAQNKTPSFKSSDPLLTKIKKIFELLNQVLPISLKYDLVSEEECVVLKITSATCKLCPKGVGAAELEGTLCPVPGMVEETINIFMHPEEVKLVLIERNVLSKIGDECVMKFKAS